MASVGSPQEQEGAKTVTEAPCKEKIQNQRKMFTCDTSKEKVMENYCCRGLWYDLPLAENVVEVNVEHVVKMVISVGLDLIDLMAASVKFIIMVTSGFFR